MGRRERAGEIDLSYHQLARKAFVERWDSGYYDVLRVENALYDKALSLIASVTPALRALDALHLTVAIAANVKEMVTADKVMAERARELQLNVHYFK
jgi:predicted nucleic acid-binding protein